MKLKIGFRGIAVLGMIALSLTGLRAQSNSEYSFTQSSQIDGKSFGRAGTSTNIDPVPIFSIDCLAANGFGQWTWTSITNGSFNAGWYLLENALRKPAIKFDASDLIDNPGCIPPGVVQSGLVVDATGTTITSSLPTEPEVTANLDSWVNYLWPDRSTSGPQFVVNFYQPSDFDLTADFCSNPTIGAMNIIGGLTPTTIAHTTVSTSSHAVVSITKTAHTDYRDAFDRTSDAHFLYVVWADGTGQIWATVQILGSSSAVSGFPILVGLGSKPTIACDVRNNRTGTFTPKFDVGFVNPGGLPADISFTGTTPTTRTISLPFTPPCGAAGGEAIASVTHVRAIVSSIAGSTTPAHGLYIYGFPNGVGNSGSTTQESLFLYGDLSSSSAPAYCDGPLLPFISPLASNNGIFDEPITAICDPYNNQNSSNAFDCFHCVYRVNGTDNLGHSVVPIIIMRSLHNGGCPSSTGNTRLILSTNGPTSFLPDPNGGYVAAVNQMGIHVHWRDNTNTHFYLRDMNRTFDEPIEENTIVTDLCAATDGSSTGTNHGGTLGAQLLPGLNMLIWTDPNYGADPGNTNSGLYQPADPTLWWTTILSYPPVGTLQIGNATQVGDGVKLTIGSAGSMIPSMLTVMPNFYILFKAASQAHGQSILINGNSTFNYYGLWGRDFPGEVPPFGDPSLGDPPNPSFDVAQFTQSTVATDGEGLVDLEGSELGPAYLTIHGGANFSIGEDAYFLSNNGSITIENEPNIFPLSSGTNPNASGLITFEGQATINNSVVNSHVGNFDGEHRLKNVMIHVPGSYEGDPGGNGDEGFGSPSSTHPYARDHAFNSTNTVYSNLNSSNEVSGLGVILFDQLPQTDGSNLTHGIYNLYLSHYDGYTTNYYPAPYMDVSSSDDIFNNVEITAMNPVNADPSPATNFSITGGTLNGTPVKSIDIENDHTYTPWWAPSDHHFWWGNILISGNTFNANGDGGGTPTGYCIYANNFQSSQYNTDSLFKLTVSSNTFSSNWDFGPQYAINFKVSDGIIGSDNTIGPDISGSSSDNAFEVGINIDGYFSSSHYDLSFVACNNNINGKFNGSSFSSVGLQTLNWQGYSELNTISGVEYGWWHKSGSPSIAPHLLGTVIKNCYSHGIQADATVDLSGLHHGSGGNPELSGAGDVAGFNQIFGTQGPQIATTDHLANVWVYQDDLGSTWSQAGMNDIYQPNAYWSSAFIIGAYSTAPANASVDIGNNFWEIGSTPVDPASTSYYWPLFNYSTTLPAVSQQTIPSFLTCGGDIFAKDKGAFPQSILTDTNSCKNALLSAIYSERNGENLSSAFDTMQWYIRNCYKSASPAYAWGSYKGAWGSAVESQQGRDSVFNFILYGLGLRNDDDWFCEGVPLLQVKYVDSYGNPDYRACRAIDRFLMDNPRCAWNYDADSSDYSSLLEGQWNLWSDTVRSNAHFDSTIPSLHDIGLDTLLKFAASSGVYYSTTGSQIIGSASIMPNPTLGQANVSLSIEREAYVHIEVFNLLGVQLSGVGYEGTFEPGSSTTPLDLSQIPAGAYYVRVTTANNEVRTLKLVKE